MAPTYQLRIPDRAFALYAARLALAENEAELRLLRDEIAHDHPEYLPEGGLLEWALRRKGAELAE